MKNLVGFLIVLLLLTFTLIACNPAAPVEPRTARVSEIVNVVEARLSEQQPFGPASIGLTLRANGQVKTGAISKARVDFSEGSIVRLSENTLLTVEELDANPGDPISRFQLTLGKIWVSVFNRKFELQTPVGVATVRGSFAVFEVVYDRPNDPNSARLIVDCLEGDCAAKNDFTDARFGNLERVVVTRQQRDILPEVSPPERLREFLNNNPNPESQRIVPTLTAAPLRTRAPILPLPETPIVRTPAPTATLEPRATDTRAIETRTPEPIAVTRTLEITTTAPLLRATPTPTPGLRLSEPTIIRVPDTPLPVRETPLPIIERTPIIAVTPIIGRTPIVERTPIRIQPTDTPRRSSDSSGTNSTSGNLSSGSNTTTGNTSGTILQPREPTATPIKR